MKITNIRFGFATNSSSSHSLIFLPEGVQVKDKDVMDGEFGWNFWTAASKQAKSLWLATLLKENLTLPDYIQEMVVGNLTGRIPSEDSYIDHQSVYDLPKQFGTDVPDREFFEDLQIFILRDDVVLLGGNDNLDIDEEGHPLASKYPSFKLPIPEDTRSKLVCRKDNNVWTVFNQNNGTKIRFSFDNINDKISANKIVKPSAPELIDLKITNKCPYGCEFCYQDSMPDGKELTEKYLPYGLARDLAELKVFEVALSGGESTLSPLFMDFLREFRGQGIVPNFSTRNFEILHEPVKSKEIMELIGGLAFSIKPYEQDVFEKIKADIIYNNLPSEKVSFQLILELFNKDSLKWALEQICENDFEQVTFLGYKEVGRGKIWKSKPKQTEGDWWINVIKDFQKKYWLKVGVDTSIAKKDENELKKHNVDNRLYEVEEGINSCYIDLVENKIGPSSFCDEKEMIKLDRIDAESITEAFAKF